MLQLRRAEFNDVVLDLDNYTPQDLSRKDVEVMMQTQYSTDVQQEPTKQEQAARFVCPSCGQIGNKVSGIVKRDTTQGTAQTTGTMSTYGGAGFNVGSQSSTTRINTMTNLARTLGSPRLPHIFPLWQAILIGVAIMLFTLLFPLGWIAAIGVPIYLMLVHNPKARIELPIKQGQLAVWQQLYYCGNCDEVFLPGTKKFIASDNMQSLLREEATIQSAR